MNLQGDQCVQCHSEFVRSFLTFELLPVVEFHLEPGISDEEALQLLEMVSGAATSGPAGSAAAAGWRAGRILCTPRATWPAPCPLSPSQEPPQNNLLSRAAHRRKALAEGYAKELEQGGAQMLRWAATRTRELLAGCLPLSSLSFPSCRPSFGPFFAQLRAPP